MNQATATGPPKKFVEPTLHFTRKTLARDEAAGDSALLVSELVRAGQVLADFPDFHKLKDRGFEKAPLKAGAHTEFLPDGSALVASVIGYPKLEQVEQPEGQMLSVVSITPLVKLSFDRLSALLVIQPTIPGRPGLQGEDLSSLLKEAGLQFGIDQEALELAKKIISSGEIEVEEIQIAAGRPPGQGTDASLSFEMEIGPIAGLIRDDGSIDYRERRIMIAVKKDQIIARKLPAVPGTPGINVLGESIDPKTGKDIIVRVQGDVSFFREQLEVRATKDGVLSVINNTTIKVSSRHVVNSDVDYTTGNIESNGCLSVRGSVQPGFVVSSAGDLEIGGSVMSAAIRTDANALIKGGVTGKTSTVNALGDVDLKFIEQGSLRAGGIVVIRKQAYFSTITSQADIRCHPSSIVMGGSLIAAGHLSLGSIGSESSGTSVIGAGIDPERLESFEHLKQTLKNQQKELIQWLQMHGTARSRKVRKMEQAIDETKVKLLQFNLIPGTELYSRNTKGDSREDVEEENPLYHQGLDVDKIRISIHGTAHKGTRLLLGNRSMLLQQKVAQRQFKLSADMKRIIALPLRGR